jgi:hypothetical protein
MTSVSENDLRAAKPRLICYVENEGPGIEGEGLRFGLTPYISDVDLGWDELLDEGFDPSGMSGLGPVYFRIVARGDERFYVSTFMASRSMVLKAWGTDGLAYCDPVTGMAPARIETRLSPDATP